MPNNPDPGSTKILLFMSQNLPNPLIATVASVLASHIGSHSRIDNLFMRCKAPGSTPSGNMVDKITAWLKAANDDPAVDAFAVLGCALENYMEIQTEEESWLKQRAKVVQALADYGLSYERGGHIIGGATGAPSRSLNTIIRERDLTALKIEFDRALATVESDPPAAVTAACSIVESLCKVYIEDNHLELPADQSLKPLWRVVQKHLRLDPPSAETEDMMRILGGLASVVDGVGSLRTHAGSAHGRGREQFQLEPRHARLAVHAAHTVVGFVLETWPNP